MTTLDTALAYLSAGLSVIPIHANGSKSPVIRWTEYRHRFPTNEELTRWFTGFDVGLAVVCGKISGNLVVLDFEDAESFDQWAGVMNERRPGILKTLPVIETPSGGRHVYYRSQEPPDGNKKLALYENGDTMIEVRAEGGYVLAPGCPPACHPTGKEYRWVQRGWLDAS